MFDILAEAAAIHRAVRRDDAAQTVTAVVRRRYEADVADVWDALTTPERLARWFSTVTGDLAVGGTFQVQGNASGEVRECEPPHRFLVTFGSPDSVVEVLVRDADGGASVELVHTVPLAMAQSGAGALFPGPGWDGAVLGLAWHLAGKEFDPVEAASSPEIVEFNAASIDRWVETVEASGTATAEEIAAAREVAVQQYTVLPD